MSFLKVKVRQQTEGKPGFVGADELDVQINTDQITLFNKSEEDQDVTFVRMTCGATLCVVMPADKFLAKVK